MKEGGPNVTDGRDNMEGALVTVNPGSKGGGLLCQQWADESIFVP